MKIKDWNGKEIEVAQSRGGVLATAHPFDNVISTGIKPWPPIELVQKCVQSGHQKDFSGENLKICTSGLKYYCDLQSLRSEDALTWSVFGTISRGDRETRAKWVAAFFKLLGLQFVTSENTEFILWRRIPHPEKPDCEDRGPELDFGILTDTSVVFGEAKWRAPVATNQGVNKDKSQLELRREFLKKYADSLYGDKQQLKVIGVYLKEETFETARDIYKRYPLVSWDQVCSLNEHPNSDELNRYLSWKIKHQKGN